MGDYWEQLRAGGNGGAQESLFADVRRIGWPVVARRRPHDPDTCEEVLSVVFEQLLAFARREERAPVTNGAHLIRRRIEWVLNDERKRHWRSRRVMLDEGREGEGILDLPADGAAAPSDGPEQRELRESILAAVRRIVPEDRRQIWWAYNILGHQAQRIAEGLRRKPAWVRGEILAANLQMRPYLKGPGEDE